MSYMPQIIYNYPTGTLSLSSGITVAPTPTPKPRKPLEYDTSYERIALAVREELGRYHGFGYAEPFHYPVDVERLAIAIQRAVSHKQDGGCYHDPECNLEEEHGEELKRDHA